MRSWTAAGGDAEDALAEVIGLVGSASFGQAALQRLARAIPACAWAAYRKPPVATPRLLVSASLGRRDITLDCWKVYVAGAYRLDDTLVAPPGGAPWVVHTSADEIPRGAHREAIYRRHGLVDRLSVVTRGADGATTAVNLYRDRSQGRFRDAEVARLDRIARGLVAAVERHATLSLPARSSRTERELTVEAARHRLTERCPALTPRELDVCARLLVGMSFDGAACDLAIGAATAKTYRNRAFARLGIRHRHELFRLCAGAR